MLDAWLRWVARSPIPAFVEMGRRIRKNRPGIEAALIHDMSIARVESTNTKIRSSPASHSGSARPKPSSRWPSSTEAATARRCQDGHDCRPTPT